MSSNNKPWVVLRCVPALELKSEKLLRRLGFVAVAPYEESLRRIRGNNRPWKWPLFQGYVFASWSNWADGWNRIRGVDSVTGEIDESKAITAIYSFLRPKSSPYPYELLQADVDYLLSISDGKYKRDEQPEPRLKIGNHVLISDGPFQGYTGTIKAIRGKIGTVEVQREKIARDIKLSLASLEKM